MRIGLQADGRIASAVGFPDVKPDFGRWFSVSRYSSRAKNLNKNLASCGKQGCGESATFAFDPSPSEW